MVIGQLPKDYKYWIKKDDWDEDDAIPFQCCWSQEDLEYAAEDGAEEYWYHCDGYEDTWPQTFQLLDENKNLLGSFEIDLRSDPQFSAHKKE